jgi:hypothetical protein
MSLSNVLDEVSQPFRVPPICKHGCLKNFVKDCAVDERSTSVTSSFDSVLEHGTATTTERISYNCGGEKMVGMQYQQVAGIVNDAPSTGIKKTDHMNESFWSDWCLNPRISKMDKFHCFCLVDLEEQDLFTR